MIKVKDEIVESVAKQFQTRGAEDYVHSILSEMKEENPMLAKSIYGTSMRVLEELKVYEPNMSEQSAAFIFANLCCLSFATYNAIKQQIICNELENA